tara:strand:+ start:105 stop:443 length:339 start_codon:yes stop_codon:yes gene_type:complete
MKEYQLQKALIKWINLKYPKLLYCASAGGMRTSFTQAKRMKATGYVKGFPDLFVYESKGNFHGLAIEIKILKGRPSISQLEWIDKLEQRGYYAKVCKGFEQCKSIIELYMKL